MSDNFFINEPFTVSQNTDVYAKSANADETTYDYVLSINVNGVWNSMNDLFGNRVFIQSSPNENTADENNVNIMLDANVTALNSLLYSNGVVGISSSKTSIATTNAAVYGTLLSGNHLLGLRFLEIVATKVFGHAKARAAIDNDTQFYAPASTTSSIINQIVNGINNAVANKKADIFNMYVAFDRIQNNVNTNTNADVYANQNFNFDGTQWQFPIYFLSTVTDTTADSNLGLVNNGPDVGGNVLINGSMNVPVLLKFMI